MLQLNHLMQFRFPVKRSVLSQTIALPKKKMWPMRNGKLVRLALVVVFTLILGSLFDHSVPTVSAARIQRFGFAWADQPSTNNYSPSPTYAFNSVGGNIVITRLSTGRYSVKFFGLGGNGQAGGHVQVTAYGSFAASCKVVYWSSEGADFIADVLCFTPNGQPTDMQYSIFVFWPPEPDTAIGFVWADRPSDNFYNPSPLYAYNSTGQTIEIGRNSLGYYTIRFLSLSAQGGLGGNVQVTAYGDSASLCKVENWYPSGVDLLVNVRCFDPLGNPIDSQFTALIGWPGSLPSRSGYAWGDNPTAIDYVPNGSYLHNDETGEIRVNRVETGQYLIHFSRLGGQTTAGGNVQVTAYSGDNNTCQVVYWDSGGPDFITTVRCFTATGTPINSMFSVLTMFPGAQPVNVQPQDPGLAVESNSQSQTPAASEIGAAKFVYLPLTNQWQLQLERLRVADAQEEDFWSDGDEPYFVVIGFRSRFNTPGSTLAFWSEYLEEDWANGVDDGDQKNIPQKMGLVSFTNVAEDVVTLDKIINQQEVNPEIVGALVIALESDGTPWGTVRGGMNKLRGALEREFRNQIENKKLDLRDPTSLSFDFGESIKRIISSLKPDFWEAVGIVIESVGDPDDFIGYHLFVFTTVDPALDSFIQGVFPANSNLTVGSLSEHHYQIGSNPIVFKGDGATYEVTGSLTPAP